MKEKPKDSLPEGLSIEQLKKYIGGRSPEGTAHSKYRSQASPEKNENPKGQPVPEKKSHGT